MPGRTADTPHVALAPADDSPHRLASQFSAADLPGQFVLTRATELVPPGWAVHQHHGWFLGAHSWLPVATMVASDGAGAGWLLGHPIDESAEFVEGVARLPFDSRAASDQMEAWLARLCGRFLAIWLTPNFERVYLDAGATLAAVFAREHDLVASTTSLVPYGRGCDDNLDLLRRCNMPDGKAMLGFGLTSRLGVDRLHPNHFLDLRRWTSHRHWPVAPLDSTVDPGAAIDVVSRIIHRQITAVARRGRIQLPLTSGYDSRSLLACSREHLERIDLMTITIADHMGRVDVEMASRLAARHGLAHRIIQQPPITQQDRDGWFWRTGTSLSEPRAWRVSRAYRTASWAPEIMGVGGEAARVAYWRDLGRGKKLVTPALVADCINLPPSFDVVSRTEAWMKDYPASTLVQLADGFYVEQSLGISAGALAYGDADYIRCRISPFVSRESFEAMMRLPEAYKLAGRFQRDLIAHHWPGLLRTPFNRRAFPRYLVDRARRRVWFWRRAIAVAFKGR